MDCDFPSCIQAQTQVEGLRSKPGESGQHKIVHQSRHDLTAHTVVQVRHIVIDQESEVKQEQGTHKVDEDLCGISGLDPPVWGDD